MAARFLTPQKIINLAQDPVIADSGDLYFNTQSNVYKYYNGSGWTSITSGGVGTDADMLDGQHASYYLNTSSNAQTKLGTLNLTTLGTNFSEIESKSTSLIDTTNTQIDSFNMTTHRSAQYFLQYVQGTQVINTAVLVIHNGTDVAMTEYGTIKIVNDLQVAITADLQNPFLRLYATSMQASAGSPVEIKFTRNLIKV